MLIHARIVPNQLGQPYKLQFGKPVLQVLGLNIGGRVDARATDTTITLTPNPEGEHVIRAYNVTKRNGRRIPNAPYVSLSALLSEANARQKLTRAPLHAEVVDGSLVVSLYDELSDDEYKHRRWKHYQRDDMPVSPDGAMHLANMDAERNTLSLVLAGEMYRELKEEADALHMTVPRYIVEQLKRRDRLKPPTAENKNYVEIGHIRRAAGDKVWHEKELIERGLPLCWDHEWLRARVAEGMSYSEMARRYGYSVSMYSKEALKLGIKRK